MKIKSINRGLLFSSLLTANLLYSATITVTGNDLAGAVSSATSGDTITISGTITATEVNITSKNLTFAGTSHLTDIVQAQADVTTNANTKYIFRVKDSNVTFSNITIKNATQNTQDANGSAINAYNAVITIKDSNISHNSADRGGAIYLYDADLNISNSILSENNTTQNINTNSGGAIYVDGLGGGYNNGLDASNIGRYNYITISGSTLYKNSSTGSGGFLYNYSVRDIYIKVSDSNFTSNSVLSGNGGIFYFNADDGFIDLNITTSYFYMNSASSKGAVMSIDSTDSDNFLHVNKSTFIKNHSSADGGVFFGGSDGYAKYIFENSSFSENNTTTDGGIMDVETDGVDQDVIVNDCNFTNNRAQDEGGLFYLEADDGGLNFEMNRVIASGNSARKGGIIFFDGDAGGMYPVINDSNFTGNQATHTTEGGGVFYMHPDYGNIELTLNSCHFEENNATKDGGVVFFDSEDGESIFIANDSTFIKNYVGDDGGVVYMADGGYQAFNRAIFNNSLLKENNATYGGAIRIEDEGTESKYNIKLFGSTMISNKAEYGGAIYADIGDNPSQRTIIDIYNSKIINNETNTSGGGGLLIHRKASADDNDTGTGLITLKNSIISGNSAKDSNGSNCYNDYNTSRDTLFNSLGGNIFENTTECFGTSSDKSLASSGYTSSDLPTLEIMQVVASKWNMVSIKNGYTTTASGIKDSSETTISNIYSFDGTSWTTSPTTITPKTGLWISQGTSSTIWIKGTSDTTNDIKSKKEQFAYYKGLSTNTWHLVGVKYPMKWSELTRSNITPDSCSTGYTKTFYLNSSDDSWNSVDTLPSNGAVWLKHFCN